MSTVLMAWLSGTLGLIVGQQFVTDEKDVWMTVMASGGWLGCLLLLALFNRMARWTMN